MGSLKEGEPLLNPKPVSDTISNASKNGCQSQALHPSQYILMGLLALTSFTVTICFAIMVTFFPEEASQRGSTEWQTGFIFSIFEVGCFILSPLYGKYLPQIGAKFLFVSGLASLSVSTILFGILAFSPHGQTFVVSCLAVRSFQGLSAGAYKTALLAVVANRFPTRVATVMGIVESSGGAAFLLGPLIGGLLYQAGGYLLPFVILGGVNFSMALISFKMLPRQQDTIETHSIGSVFRLLTVPGVGLPLCTILTVAITMSFLDLTLAPQMDKFGSSVTLKGILFLVLSATYVLAAPLWGRLANNKRYRKPAMLCGALVNAVALLFVGPSPVLGATIGSATSMGVALGTLGIGIGAQVIPPFVELLLVIKTNGYVDDLRTDGLVSGLINTFSPLGAFIGPSIGGFINQAIGFPWSTTGLALTNLCLGIAFLVQILPCTNIQLRHRNREISRIDSQTPNYSIS